MYIAVCDDQTEELKDLTELLGAWETDRGTPVRVKSFRSAAELLDAARHERFTLYLLDIMMPGLNGMDAAREIRGFDKAADIIFLTSSPRLRLRQLQRQGAGISAQAHSNQDALSHP